MTKPGAHSHQLVCFGIGVDIRRTRAFRDLNATGVANAIVLANGSSESRASHKQESHTRTMYLTLLTGVSAFDYCDTWSARQDGDEKIIIRRLCLSTAAARFDFVI